jgi:hypothetical protein
MATLLMAVAIAVAVPGVFRVAAELGKSPVFTSTLQKMHLL